MPLYQALVLGIIQGATEFWPISSSAHIALASWLFRWSEPGLYFVVALHLGTLLALIIYFHRLLGKLLAAAWDTVRFGEVGDDRGRKLVLYIFIATLPAFIIGGIAGNAAEHFQNLPLLIILLLLGFSFVLLWADRTATLSWGAAEMGARSSLAIGISQVLSFMPGISRSGATISAGLLVGLKREEAAMFSFLLSLPTVGGAFLYSLWKMIEEGVDGSIFLPMLAGTFTSTLVGLAAIHLLLRRVRSKDFTPFVAYRFAIAAILLLIFLLK
jgi:undecaprenyl-diphosphatase